MGKGATQVALLWFDRNWLNGVTNTAFCTPFYGVIAPNSMFLHRPLYCLSYVLYTLPCPAHPLSANNDQMSALRNISAAPQYNPLAAANTLHIKEKTFIGACATNNQEALADYIRCGSDIEEALPDGTRAMHIAVIFHCPNIVHILITSGADPYSRQESGLTPLHFAAVAGYCDVINILLTRGGVNINARDHSGMTPLHHAAVCGRLEAMCLLVAKGASREMQECLGLSPLGCAVRNQQLLAITELIQLGSNVNSKDIHGRTLLHLAAELGFVEVAKLLVDGGANKQALNAQQQTPGEVIPDPLCWEMRYLLD